MAKLPAIRTEGASPFARRSRMPAGSFDELLIFEHCPGNARLGTSQACVAVPDFARRHLFSSDIAIECGAPVVPAYAFGENQLFHTHSQLESCRLWLVRRWRLGAPS